MLLGTLGVGALVSHGMLPAGSAAASTPWFAALACAINLAVGMIGAIAFFNTSLAHAAAGQSTRAVTAGHVLGGSGLDGTLLAEARKLPGCALPSASPP